MKALFLSPPVTMWATLTLLAGGAMGQVGVSVYLTDPSYEIDGRFGADVLIVDLNLDGNTEVVIGAPGKTAGGLAGAGKVMIRIGPVSGPPPPIPWSMIAEPTSVGGPEAGGNFGARLETGDFNMDGFPDLAVSADEATTYAGYPAGFAHGEVIVLYGPWALGTVIPYASAQSIIEPVANINLASEAGDRFGTRIDAGDANNDGFTDLLVGAPFSNVNVGAVRKFLAGETYLYLGGASPLTSFLVVPHPNGPKGDSLWGWDLEIGNLRDPEAAENDIVVAAYNYDFPFPANAGEVWVFHDIVTAGFAATTRLISFVNQPNQTAQGSDFGWELALGNYFGSGFDDLMVGAPSGWSAGGDTKGDMQLFPGGAAFGQANPANFGCNAVPPIPPLANPPFDRFGAGLAFIDHDGDGFQDSIVVAAPWFDYGIPASPLRGEGRAWRIDTFTGGGLWRSPNAYVIYDDPSPEQLTGAQGWGSAAVRAGHLNANANEDFVLGNQQATIQGKANAGEIRIVLY